MATPQILVPQRRPLVISLYFQPSEAQYCSADKRFNFVESQNKRGSPFVSCNSLLPSL